MSNYNLQDDVNNKFPVIWAELTRKSNPTCQEKPVAVLLGGQPGAGKSFGTQRIRNQLDRDAIVINGDEFRPFRAGYEEIYKQYGKDAAEYAYSHHPAFAWPTTTCTHTHTTSPFASTPPTNNRSTASLWVLLR